jgi:hypothetical protein
MIICFVGLGFRAYSSQHGAKQAVEKRELGDHQATTFDCSLQYSDFPQNFADL